VTGTDKDGHFRRESLKLRDWNRAQELVRKWDVEGEKPIKRYHATIDEWKEAFLQDAEKGRHLSHGTMRLYKLLFRQLNRFCEERGIKFVSGLDLNALTDFRASWNVGSLTAVKRLERLRSVMKFAVQRKMVEENHALHLSNPKEKANPTLPFSKDEMAKILKAADSDTVDVRAKTFIQSMRYSGLRISDTATLRKDSLFGDRLKLYQAKTGEPVSVLLPKHVGAALRALPSKGEHFFWTGKSRVSSTAGFWRARIAKVFKLAKIENGHTHRFRDTFAVALLESGASLENVSVLLGHTSIRVTQKHYNPWVKSRQDALDNVVKKAIGY
jgi:site-specific recombinase XerD